MDDFTIATDPLSRFLEDGEPMTVSSSWIDSLRYDAERGELYVRVQGGTEYGPWAATPDMAREFAEAPSKGQWYHANLKGTA